MDRLITAMRKPRNIVLCVLLGGYWLFSFLTLIANRSLGSVGTLFYFFALTGLIAALIVALFLNVDKAIKVLGIMLFAYWALGLAIGELPGYTDISFSVDPDFNGAWAIIVSGVFILIALLAALGILVLFVLPLFISSMASNSTIKLVSRILALVFLGSYFVSKLFLFIGYCIFQYAWGSHMDLIAELFMGCTVFYGYFLIVDRD